MQNFFRIIFIIVLFSCNEMSSSVKVTKDTISAASTEATNDKATERKIENTALFDTYCNARYDYCVDYPKELIYPQPESYNGDGRIFKNKLGDTILTVFGRMNTNIEAEEISLAQQYNNDLHELNGNDNEVITYQKLGKTFFVISGHKNVKIFYQKTILKENAFAYAILEYNKKDKVMFDKVSERIFLSFK